MNKLVITNAIGSILKLIAILMSPPILVALVYGEGWQGSYPFLIPIVLCLVLSIVLRLKRPKSSDYFMREGFVIVASTWLLLSLFGCLPFVLSGQIPNFIDAFFESASGFTTTGASIVPNVESLSHSILFWRSFTHFIGGMGILVFALAIMPKIQSDDVYAMRAEVAGPVFGKIHGKVRKTAQVLYLIYCGMTLLLMVLLLFGGMPLFDSLCNALGTAGTGGFGLKATSIAGYESAYAEVVIGFGMLAFGMNFALIYQALNGNVKSVLKSEELRWYLGFILGAMVLISLNVSPLYESVPKLLRDVFFTVSAIVTTTGFATADFNQWPLFSQIILVFLMFVGGMAGSTAGGMKVSRIVIYVKSAIQEWRRNLSPNRQVPVRFEGRVVTHDITRQVGRYLTLYILIYILFMLLLSLDLPDFTSTFTAVSATFNNIGPGLGSIGPSSNFAHLSSFSKVLLSFSMIMGRLEIFPILILFSPRTWRRT